MKRFFVGPLFDFLDAMQRLIPTIRWHFVVLILLITVGTWWLYVPAHELLHVAGCLATGGEVSQLDISPEYGAALLAKIFPFVSVGSDYPGQLTGFDTHGNDLIYLATVYAPYLLSIFIGAPLMRRLADRGLDRTADRIRFGVAIPLAFAPFINVLGDYYELASIPVSRVAAGLLGGGDPARWRSDDFLKLARSLSDEGGLGTADLLTLVSGAGLGALAAFGTYRLGTLLYDRIARKGDIPV